MELTTRCTHCQHQFQTTIHALQRRKGYVRCQQCGTIFDGFDAVVDDIHTQDEPSALATPVVDEIALSEQSVQHGLYTEREELTGSTAYADHIGPGDEASYTHEADIRDDEAEEVFHAAHTGLGQQGQVSTQADQLWAAVQHKAQEQLRPAADTLPQVIHLGRRKATAVSTPIPLVFDAEEAKWKEGVDECTDEPTPTVSIASSAYASDTDTLTRNEPSWHISEAVLSHETQATPSVIRHRVSHTLQHDSAEPYLNRAESYVTTTAVEHDVQGLPVDRQVDEPFYADAVPSAAVTYDLANADQGSYGEGDDNEPTFSMQWVDATELEEPVIALRAEPPPSKTLSPTLWQRLVALFWRLCLMALLTLALLQAVYVYRNQIANSVPMLRIPLMLLCKSLDCEISYERQPKFIHALSSRLEELSHRPGEGYRYALKLELRNSYHRPQQWPDLAIRFKRSATSEIETHSFSPEQYLTPAQRRKPLAANSDAAVVLPLASTQRITHYDIHFYFH